MIADGVLFLTEAFHFLKPTKYDIFLLTELLQWKVGNEQALFP